MADRQPRLLLDIVAALYDELTPTRRADACAAIDHFIPDSTLREYTGTSTGANRVDLCRSVALRGVLGRAPEKIALARDALSPVFPYVTRGDGLYADGSFVQHTWVAYAGTYGQVLLDGLGRLFALLAGSTWEVTDPNRQIVLDSVERAYAPLLHDGLVMDSVNGRAISRGYLKDDDRHIMRSDHFHGQGIIAAIALLALGATTAERERWHGRIKGWIERDTVTPILTARQFGVADLARLHAVAASPVAAAPDPVGHRLFPAMDRAVHRRPDFTVNIAMASDRIAHYECGNGENPRGWHTGAGTTLWWAEGHGDQYTNWFWPTVDWYRLPGTTVSTKRLADKEGGEWGAPKPAARWVGGTTDGEYAAIGQHLEGLGSTLRARKSWFCVADAVICLGAGISCADGVPVETVVDNRNLGRWWARPRSPSYEAGAGSTSKATVAGSSRSALRAKPRAPCARTAPAPGPTSTSPVRPNAAPGAGRPSGWTTAPIRWTPPTSISSCPERPAGPWRPGPPTGAGCRSSPTTAHARPSTSPRSV